MKFWNLKKPKFYVNKKNNQQHLILPRKKIIIDSDYDYDITIKRRKKKKKNG